MKKSIFFIATTLFYLTTFGQQINIKDWDEQALTNIRLLPKYGHVSKSEDQKQADQEFIELALKSDTTHRKASNHLIQLGFHYLYSNDLKTAMYRFNQAYLLDSTNTDIYWGYGSIYITLGDFARGKQQYEQGLAIDPASTHILTDYGTSFLMEFYHDGSKKGSEKYLDSAIIYMTKSYKIDPSYQNTTFKLSICYWNKGDCDNAWKFYNECKKYGGQPITEDYTKALANKCKQPN